MAADPFGIGLIPTDAAARLRGMIVWGIDPSTKRIATSVVDVRRRRVTHVGTLSLPTHERALKPRELAEQMAAQQEHFRGLVDSHGRPTFVAIERPFGGGGSAARKVPVESYYAFAITLAALAASVGRNVGVLELDPGSWKARSLGKGFGHAKKPAVLAWARERHGYVGSCKGCADGLNPATEGKWKGNCPAQSGAHDEADAIGVGIACIEYVPES